MVRFLKRVVHPVLDLNSMSKEKASMTSLLVLRGNDKTHKENTPPCIEPQQWVKKRVFNDLPISVKRQW